MRLRRIASIAQEEGITYRNAMRVLKRNRVKIYGTGEKKAVDAEGKGWIIRLDTDGNAKFVKDGNTL